MKLKGSDLRERFSDQLQQIEVFSRNFAVFLSEEGLEEAHAEKFMNFFASDSSLSEHESTYKDMLSANIGIEYFKVINSLTDYKSISAVYAEYAAIAWKEKIPVDEFEHILNGKELYEIEEALDQYESKNNLTGATSDASSFEEAGENTMNLEIEHEINAEIDKIDEAASEEKKPKVEIIENYKPHIEKNFFTQTIEDLLGVSVESLETEEQDGNLDTLVKSITDAILEDKRKTNLINNLRKIVILANKQVIRMNNRIKNCANVENELRNQIYSITQERDEYRRRFEELNSKISELNTITSTANFGGVKQIE